MAIYEEDNDGLPSLIHNAGDGTSASSVGTNSPEPNMFQVNIFFKIIILLIMIFPISVIS